MTRCPCVYESKYITIYFDEINKHIARDYLECAENTYLSLITEYEFDLDVSTEKINIYLCEKIEDYLFFTEKKTEDYQNWMVGWAENRKVCLLSPNAGKNTEEYIQSILIHEIVHIVFDACCGKNGPLWLVEGIAVMYSNQTCIEYINIDKFPKISDISKDNEIYFSDNGGYDYAGIYTWYIIKNYGIKVFIRMYSGEIDFIEYIIDGFEEDAIRCWIESYEKSTRE